MRTPLGLLGIYVGHLWHAIAGVALGGINWTVGTAGKFVLNTLAGLVKLLIPTSWIHAGLSVMQWLVAVPDYSARITSPDGAHVYGFAGINDLRELMTWVGIARPAADADLCRRARDARHRRPPRAAASPAHSPWPPLVIFYGTCGQQRRRARQPADAAHSRRAGRHRRHPEPVHARARRRRCCPALRSSA